MKLIYSLIASLVLCSVPLLAEPVDMNFGGPFLSGGFLIGQSGVAGGDVTPGQSFGLSTPIETTTPKLKNVEMSIS